MSLRSIDSSAPVRHLSVVPQTPTKPAAATPHGADVSVSAPADVDDAPPLPDVDGATVPQAQLRRQLAAALLAPCFAWAQALDVLLTLGNNSLEGFGNLKRLAYKANHQFQEQAAAQQIEQVRGDRRSATVKIAGSSFAAAAGFSAGMYGNLGNGMWHAVAQNLGPQLGRTLTDLTDVMDKCLPGGGSYKSQQANLRRTMADNLAKTNERTEQTINDCMETARRALSSALELNIQVSEKNGQIMRQITQNV